MRRPPRPERGFTLIEAVLVIVITGVLAAVAGQFIALPVQAYLSLSARARMADSADLALRHVGRELRRALPNSVRISADGRTLEFIPTTAGARYQTQGLGALLDGVLVTTFNVLGPGLTLSRSPQQLVFYNLGPGNTGSDAYAPSGSLAEQAQSNRRTATDAVGTVSLVHLSSLAPLPAGSVTPPYRVFAVLDPVSLHCDTGTGLLTRHTGYGFLGSQPTPPPGTGQPLAEGVGACRFSLGLSAQGQSLVQMQLTLTSTPPGGAPEQITLHHAVHIDNVP